MTRSVTKTPRDKAAQVGWMRRRRRGERDEWCQGRRIGRDETGFALLITRRSQPVAAFVGSACCLASGPVLGPEGRLTS